MDTDFEQEKALIQKLMRTFMSFKRVPWYQQSVGGYKPSEIRTLICIKKGIQLAPFTMKVSDISKLLHVTAPTVTQMINGLEAEGLVERNVASNDRRAVGVKLTAKGEAVTQKAEEDFYATLHGLVAYLGTEQSYQLIDLLAKVSYYFAVAGSPENQEPHHHSEHFTTEGDNFAASYAEERPSSLAGGEDVSTSYCGDSQV